MEIDPKVIQKFRGVKNAEEAKQWLASRSIEDIECVIIDQSGIARGKMMPPEKFFSANTMALPASVFSQTISGDYPEEDDKFSYDPTDGDMLLIPDYSTLTTVPWASDPTAQIIHDAVYKDGTPIKSSPRYVLRRVLELFEKEGWKPVVAPEIEFYLVKPNTDPDYPLEPPIGRSGRAEVGRQSYSISAVNEFDDLFDDIYEFSEAQGLEIDTLIHEDGAAQMEINLRHGNPMELADQVFFFKRTIREAAMRHSMYATFMAKPMSSQPGSAMHIHQSIVDMATGQNLFSDEEGQSTSAFFSFVAGLQAYLPHMMSMLAPYVNSYRRLTRHAAAPINVRWGYDNRTVGLRIPHSGPEARRVENRVPGSDTNPYLAVAASLACGYLGMKNGLTPTDPLEGSAMNLPFDLPRSLLDALQLLTELPEVIELLGEDFTYTYRAVKLEEVETFMQVISPWERENLLLNV